MLAELYYSVKYDNLCYSYCTHALLSTYTVIGNMRLIMREYAMFEVPTLQGANDTREN